MTGSDAAARVYEELADRYDRQKEAKQRDLFLVLAADAAHSAGRRGEAERLREALLHVSPHNLLRPYRSFSEALQSSDIQLYIADLRRQYPPDMAQRLLKSFREKEQTNALAGQRAHSDGNTSEEPELKVFKLQEDQTSGRSDSPAGRSPAPRPPVKMGPLPTPSPSRSAVSSARPRQPPEKSSPYDPGPVIPLVPTAELEERRDRSGAWVCYLLFLLVLGVSLAFGFLALVRPLQNL
jgi:hypothetical protein